jgi:hypothetical protein
VAEHSIGHLPFEADITNVLKYGQENRVTVLCDNVLTSTTIPQGTISEVETQVSLKCLSFCLKFYFRFLLSATMERKLCNNIRLIFSTMQGFIVPCICTQLQ